MRRFGIVVLLAWRYLWRNHRRTIIMLAAITVGAWAMIFMTALIRGMVNEMVLDSIRALPGHVQVHQVGYRDDPSIDNLIAMPDHEIAAAFARAGIESWTSRVRVPAVISSERESRGVTLVGADPRGELLMEAVGTDISLGRNLADVTDNGIVLGKKLADNLDTRIGKRVVVMSQDPDNEIADRGFRVVGLFDANMQQLEEGLAIIGKTTAQKMLKIGDHVSEVAVLGEHYRDVSGLTDRVRSVMPQDVEVLPWQEIDTYLGTMLGVMDGFVLVWIVVIFLALSFGLVNTLVMAVFERVREIGLMLALGMRPGNILAQIVIESTLLLAIGLLVGNLLAWASIVPLRNGIDLSIVGDGMEMFGMASVLYPDLLISDVVLTNIVVLILGFVASLSPAWRASRYEPVEAITKE